MSLVKIKLKIIILFYNENLWNQIFMCQKLCYTSYTNALVYSSRFIHCNHSYLKVWNGILWKKRHFRFGEFSRTCLCSNSISDSVLNYFFMGKMIFLGLVVFIVENMQDCFHYKLPSSEYEVGYSAPQSLLSSRELCLYFGSQLRFLSSQF